MIVVVRLAAVDRALISAVRSLVMARGPCAGLELVVTPDTDEPGPTTGPTRRPGAPGRARPCHIDGSSAVEYVTGESIR
ncbi:hypothetical protein [Micromonospora noduli]|uniref:hypothetical protein n=1 Tax=Micromonospora noduli TaxID=709876 RepID=UPI000DC048E2|nr:hypothetical protein [Micromonospora noduli]RAO12526.1 hypothetical protein GUI43_02780 [Micromonospora noduli]